MAEPGARSSPAAGDGGAAANPAVAEQIRLGWATPVPADNDQVCPKVKDAITFQKTLGQTMNRKG